MQMTPAQARLLGRASFNARLASAIGEGYPTLSAGISDVQFQEGFDLLIPVAMGYGFEDEWSVAGAGIASARPATTGALPRSWYTFRVSTNLFRP